MHKNRKGFTLIELIVVMSIIAVLILLAAPKYLNYTKDAQLTRIKVNIKELENANMQYYIKHNEWARIGAEPYTEEEISLYAEKVYNKTGKVVELEESGNYYDIDYAKLDKYIKGVEDKELYLLQNPVGNVYRIEGLTELGKAHFINKGLPEEEPKEAINLIPTIENGQLPANVNSLTASSVSTWNEYGSTVTYYPWRAFDGKYNINQNGWMSTQYSNAWLQVEFKSPEEINMVRLVHGPDISLNLDKRCKDFRIEYYDESVNTWKTVIQDQMQNTVEMEEFEFESVGSHKKWRLWVINHGRPGSTYVGIGEMQLLYK